MERTPRRSHHRCNYIITYSRLDKHICTFIFSQLQYWASGSGPDASKNDPPQNKNGDGYPSMDTQKFAELEKGRWRNLSQPVSVRALTN